MSRRHPLPRIWLMTDPRADDVLLGAIKRLPFGSGVIFRHYHLVDHERRALFLQVRKICRRRGHRLLLGADERIAIRWHADGHHGPTGKRRSHLIYSAPAHDMSELAVALRQSADLVLISPLFATRSHPDKRPLGLNRFNGLARLAGTVRVIALGGMDRNRAAMLDSRKVHGWAAIDAFGKVTA